MNTKGFSLLEMSIIVLIIGILLTPALTLFKVGTANRDLIAAEDDLNAVSEALTEWVGRNGYYPCPARLDVNPGDPGYGVCGSLTVAVDDDEVAHFDDVRTGVRRWRHPSQT